MLGRTAFSFSRLVSTRSFCSSSSVFQPQRGYSTATAEPTVKPYESIPYENTLKNVTDYLDGQKKSFNIVSLSDYLYNQYGPIARSGKDVMGRDYVWVMSESGLLDVSKQEGLSPDGSGTIALPLTKYNEEKVGSKLWPFSPGNLWRDRRMMAQKHIFGNLDAASHVQNINVVTRRIGDSFEEKMKTPFDQSNFTSEITFEYIYGVLFGLNPGILDGTGTEAERQFIQNTLDFFRISVYEIMQNPDEYKKLEEQGTSEKYEEFCRVTDELIDYGVKISEKIIGQMQDGTASELVRASYVARQYLEDPTADLQELSINAAVLLTAGVDTTSSIIRMIMTRLAEEPEYQEDMLKEMEAIRGDRDPFEFEYKDREKYHVLQSFIREIHRVTPLLGGFGRRLRHGITVDGYEIPPETMIFCMPTRDQANSAERWDDYHHFNPRRWYPISQGRRTVEKDLSKKWTSASVATFGRGSHKCLGFRVAEAEVMSFFTTIVPRFKWKATWDHENPPWEYSFERGLGAYVKVPKIEVERR